MAKFIDGRVNSAGESILHIALWETKEEEGIDEDKVEKLGPLARSLSGLSVWSYVVSSECHARAFSSNNFV